MHLLGAAVLVLAAVAAPTERPPASAPALMRASLYYVALESDYRQGREAAFRDRDGRTVHLGSRDFLEAAQVEASARTRDGRTLAFDPENPQNGWIPTSSAFGIDARGCPLVPYRSAAVPSWMPLGVRLFIPETVGLPLQDGKRHDGYWVAADRGLGIQGDRIDLFMSAGLASMRDGERFGLEFLKPVHVQVVASASDCPASP